MGKRRKIEAVPLQNAGLLGGAIANERGTCRKVWDKLLLLFRPQWRWWWCWWWLRGYIHICTYKKNITWLSCAVCIQCRANTTVYTRYEAFFRYCCSHYSLTYICLMSQQQYLSIVIHIHRSLCVFILTIHNIFLALSHVELHFT